MSEYLSSQNGFSVPAYPLLNSALTGASHRDVCGVATLSYSHGITQTPFFGNGAC